MNAMIGGTVRAASASGMPGSDGTGSEPRINARLARITPAQRDCLRMVLEHKKSKEIGLILGVSPHTVDKRLKAAMRTLEVDGRLAAAMLVRDHEETPSRYQRLVYQSPDLVEVPFVGQVEASDQGWSRTDEPPARNELHDVAVGDWLSAEIRPEHAVHGRRTGDAWIMVPWGSLNTLRIGQRLILILLIAGLSAVAFGSIVGSLDALRHVL